MWFYRTQRSLNGAAIKSLTIALLALGGCVRADSPELFNADPGLLNDTSASLPRFGAEGSLRYEIIQGHAILEGDIILGMVNTDGSIQRSLQSRGLGRNDLFGRWPDGIVPYLAPTSNSAIQQTRIQQAIEHWTERTSITFIERTNENASLYPNYLRFDNSNSCASYVGMQGSAQSILVSDACSMGSIVHEIGHALGLFHEHTRLDRDSFVQIDWNQIVPGKEINFDILSSGIEDIGDYDYGSIMHYGEYFFSATGLKTVIAPAGVSIGQRTALSNNDAASINSMYATDLALLAPTLNTLDEGVEIGLSIVNQGDLGAQALTLNLSFDDTIEWLGITANSGWQCTEIATSLQCSRDILEENQESRFSLTVNSPTFPSSGFTVALSSRTEDSNLGNNSYNDPGTSTPKTDTDTDTNTTTDNTSNTTTTNNNATQQPDAGAANANTDNLSSGGSSGDDATQAAGTNGLFSAMLILVLTYRRRNAKLT